MIRRYSLKLSDNSPYTGKKAYTCTGSGYIDIITGFAVQSAIIAWSSLPNYESPYEMSSSSSSTSSSSSIDSSSSSSSTSNSSSSSSSNSSSSSSNSSSSSIDSSSSSSSTEEPTSSSSSSSSTSESSLTSNEYPGPFNVPRIYVHSYLSNGFRVRYENIPEEIGFVEFAYVAV